LSSQSKGEIPEVEIAAHGFIKAIRNLDEMQIHTFRQLIQSVKPQPNQEENKELIEAFAALNVLWGAILSDSEH
jgi:ribonuclease HIII